VETRDDRPQPDALLAEARKEGRGRLKIFIGAAPGVGKTYAMLEEAQRRRKDGVDVVVGIVETHGRKDTEALVAGLEILPRKMVTYRGRPIAEFDAEAAILRRPKLLLVDELAHSNVPGSIHLKRWQDVEDLLEAGIDVYSTLNIQHIESLNDVIARISGVRVRETLPDLVIASADDIELIDLPPDELIQRLRSGKVYVQEQIANAIQNFFSKGNLTALRELAMRIAADRVDAEMTQHMQSHAIAGPWPTQERLLVAINESPLALGLIRAAKRMADRSRAAWIAVQVLRAGGERMGAAEQQRGAGRRNGDAQCRRQRGRRAAPLRPGAECQPAGRRAPAPAPLLADRAGTGGPTSAGARRGLRDHVGRARASR
jgi:two-component system sensor histidine kinase KdpD